LRAGKSWAVQLRYVRKAHHGDAWSEATASFTDEGGNVKFKTAFEYTKVEQQDASPKSKSRWQLW
jgi:hypothetical protein